MLLKPQGFVVFIDKKDRSRAKFLDIKMYTNGIAARLGLGSDALASTRGFSIKGNPKKGRLVMSFASHLDGRLSAVLEDDAQRFVFCT
eukprot:2882471-Pleurochrysis_carterae.AAC.2